MNLVGDDVQRVPFADLQFSNNFLWELQPHCLVYPDHCRVVCGNPKCAAPRILLVGSDFPFDGDQEPVGEQILPRKQMTIDHWHDKSPSTSIQPAHLSGEVKDHCTTVKPVTSIDLRG